MNYPLLAVAIALALVTNAVWAVSIRFAAEREDVEAPSGHRYAVLVNRDGVMLYTRRAAWANLYSIWPTVVALLRHGRRPWRWVVRVRPSTFAGYDDLVCEKFDTRDAAATRAAEIVELLAGGQTLWPDDAEWYR